MPSNKTPEQKEKANAYAREYRRKRTSEQKEKDKSYARSYMREYARAHRKAHPATPKQRVSRNEYMREWNRRAMADPIKKALAYARGKAWRTANPEKHRAIRNRAKHLPEPTRPEPQFCEACGGPPRKPTLHLNRDHDHKTLKFRGWLCWPCNRALGNIGDNREGVLKLLAYLEKP